MGEDINQPDSSPYEVEIPSLSELKEKLRHMECELIRKEYIIAKKNYEVALLNIQTRN